MRRIIGCKVALEDWWFDFYHHVDTSPKFREQMALGWPMDKWNFHYLPIRPKCARRVLRNLPLDPREYTFIDFGSGKGRMLFMAAGNGFRHVLGIELRSELHNRASKNVQECRHLDGGIIESLHMDAAQYEFPDDNLVLFFFNPFGSEVMVKVLAKLTDFLDRYPRDVWIVLHDSTCVDVVDKVAQFRIETARDGYRIYRSVQDGIASDL